MCTPKSNGGLEFRNLSTFNMALLAKQGWRISQRENSLLYHVYKARYFSNTNFLDSKLDTKLSYAWCGIRESIKWLKKGSIRRIGDGSKVNIWNDPWLPDNALNIQLPEDRTIEDLPTRVELLIDPYSNCWQLTTLRSLDCTLKIPLSASRVDDKLI